MITITNAALVLAPVPPVLAAGGVNIDFDRTVLIQMGLFVVLILLLTPILFRPVLRLFDEREKRTDGARSDARAMQQRAAELLSRYESELEKVERVASEERERLRAETLRLEARILEEAHQATLAIVTEGRQRIGAEVDRIRTELVGQSQVIGRQIATSVLGREVS